MARNEVAIMDFGSSKISILVAVKGVNNVFKIIATGTSDYAGFLDGEFIEPDHLAEAITYAKNQAENIYGKKIKRLYVGIPTEFCYNSLEHISMNFNSRIRVRQKNINKLFENAKIEYPGRNIINKTPLYFVLDDGNHVLNPLSCLTSTISVLASYISVESEFYKMLDTILCDLGVYTVEFISSALAESLCLIDNQLRQNGAILVDCGYITTSVNTIYFEGITDLKSFSLGGGYITSDLMEVLQIPYENAEQLKRKVILSIEPSKEDFYEVIIDNKMRRFSARVVNEICLDRIDLIIDGIVKCINSFKNKVEDETVLYLTGGGLAYIKGAVQYLEKRLNRHVEVVAPKPLQFAKPDLSSQLSLIDAAINIEKR